MGGMNMRTQEGIVTLNKMYNQLQTLYGLSCDLKNAKALTEDEFEEYFEGVRNRIDCDHNDLKVMSTEDQYYGSEGIINVVWKCNDCDTVMEGQIDFPELWRYGASSAVVREGFEVKQ
jgi:ABC-type ATPase with predicted acetyltransferase domain